mmetsp:Transcript_5134/g.11360  ORF Transcript_5134/g.11360 Transcript_5134/m.11360 type:complete len:202 (-) Transcript_5134:19-624(-)
MDAETMGAILRRNLEHLRLAPGRISYLASVLAELTPSELANFEEVRMLLEPFLLDALKPGREKPHDRKSDEKVEALCEKIFNQLSPAVAETVVLADGLAEGDAALQATKAALRRVADSTLSVSVPVADDVLAHLALVLQDVANTELADVDRVTALLEPCFLDAFHECGEWASSEDAKYLQELSIAVSHELQELRGAQHAPQ